MAALLVLLAAAGCSVAPDDAPVQSVARAFMIAVAAGDGAHACDLLTEQAADAVSGATSIPCAEAVPAVHVPGGGTVRSSV